MLEMQALGALWEECPLPAADPGLFRHAFLLYSFNGVPSVSA